MYELVNCWGCSVITVFQIYLYLIGLTSSLTFSVGIDCEKDLLSVADVKMPILLYLKKWRINFLISNCLDIFQCEDACWSKVNLYFWINIELIFCRNGCNNVCSSPRGSRYRASSAFTYKLVFLGCCLLFNDFFLKNVPRGSTNEHLLCCGAIIRERDREILQVSYEIYKENTLISIYTVSNMS